MKTNQQPVSKTGGSNTLEINPACLWGYDVSSMDADNAADGNTIIARVFDAGSFRDMQRVLAYYGPARVRQTLVEYPELQTKTINHVALWLGLTPEDFYAFRKKQQEPISFPSL